jgi:hypothetical protein
VCADFCGCSIDFMYLFLCLFSMYVIVFLFCHVLCATIMHLLYEDFFALYKFNNQSINQSINNQTQGLTGKGLKTWPNECECKR